MPGRCRIECECVPATFGAKCRTMHGDARFYMHSAHRKYYRRKEGRIHKNLQVKAPLQRVCPFNFVCVYSRWQAFAFHRSTKMQIVVQPRTSQKLLPARRTPHSLYTVCTCRPSLLRRTRATDTTFAILFSLTLTSVYSSHYHTIACERVSTSIYCAALALAHMQTVWPSLLECSLMGMEWFSLMEFSLEDIYRFSCFRRNQKRKTEINWPEIPHENFEGKNFRHANVSENQCSAKTLM